MSSSSKTSRHELSEAEVLLIWGLHQNGISGAEIARQNDFAKSTVNQILRRLRRQSVPVYLKAIRAGRPPKLSKRDERHLLSYTRRNPFENLKALSTPSKSGSKLHLNTVRSYLTKNEIYAFRPRKKPYVNKSQRRRRLTFVAGFGKLIKRDLQLISFCDESTFEIGLDTTPSWVRRPLGEAYESDYLKPTFKSGREIVSV